MHIRELPNWGCRLSERDSEVLLQILTVPYLRIPLVLDFFTDEARIQALDCKELQDIVDSALFEPGLWQSALLKDLPKTIPPGGRDHMATPCGLLFNELTVSPTVCMLCFR